MIETGFNALVGIVGAQVEEAGSGDTVEVDVAVGALNVDRVLIMEWNDLVSAVIDIDNEY